MINYESRYLTDFFDQIDRCFKNTASLTTGALINQIKQFDLLLINQRSNNGNTHIANVIDLSSSSGSPEKVIAILTAFTTQAQALSMNSNAMDSNALSSLISQENFAGETPLSRAIATPQPAILQFYLTILNFAVSNQYVQFSTYRKLLLGLPPYATPTINTALLTDSFANINVFFDHIELSMRQGFIDARNIQSIFSAQAPLHDMEKTNLFLLRLERLNELTLNSPLDGVPLQSTQQNHQHSRVTLSIQANHPSNNASRYIPRPFFTNNQPFQQQRQPVSSVQRTSVQRPIVWHTLNHNGTLRPVQNTYAPSISTPFSFR